MRQTLFAILTACVTFSEAHAASASEIYCLASVMAGEARGDGEAGMLAVADVVLSRSEDTGDTICAAAKKPRQFHGYGIRPSGAILKLAARAIRGDGRGSTHGARYFSASRDRPHWSLKMKVTARIGKQVFYSAQ